QAVPLFRERSKRLGEDAERASAHGQLPGLGAEQPTLDCNDISDIGLTVRFEGTFAELVALDVDLQAPGAILQIEERGLSEVACADDAAREADDLVCRVQPFGVHLREASTQLRRRPIGNEIVRKGDTAPCTQRLEL